MCAPPQVAGSVTNKYSKEKATLKEQIKRIMTMTRKQSNKQNEE
jgi:hypothetical protein